MYFVSIILERERILIGYLVKVLKPFIVSIERTILFDYGGYNNLPERQLAFYRIRFNRTYNTLLEARNDTNKNKDDGIFKDFET